MKTLFYSSLLLFSLGCGGSKSDNTVSGDLAGTWVPVSQEMGGASFPSTLFASETLALQDSTYVLTAESVDKGVVKCNGDKMDIYGKDGVNAGKHFTAIWKMENGNLTICYNLRGDKYPSTYETKSDTMFFMSVFKKK